MSKLLKPYPYVFMFVIVMMISTMPQMEKEESLLDSYLESVNFHPEAPPGIMATDVNFETISPVVSGLVTLPISKTSHVPHSVETVSSNIVVIISTNNLDTGVLVSSTDVNSIIDSATFLIVTDEVGLTRTPITLSSLMLSKAESSHLIG